VMEPLHSWIWKRKRNISATEQRHYCWNLVRHTESKRFRYL